MAAPWLEDLNPAQRAAVTHPGGPLLIIAGAGTGKTKTLAARVAWLIEQGTSPDRILLLTFTRRASAEMLNRAGQLTGKGAAGQVWGGTFHALSNRLLRYYGRALGLSPDFTVMDQSDAADLMNLIRGDLELGQRKKRFPQKNTLIAIYSRMVNSRTKLGEVTANWYPWCKEDLDGIRSIFQEYTTRKRAQNVLDYDDLLLYWNALCKEPEVAEKVARRFDHILVDEYQDTNLIQSEILQGMRAPFEAAEKHLTVVGDDAQSIYSFRAATVRNILDFPQQFPGTEIIKLEQNYRSYQPILDASNAVMAEAKQQYSKSLYSHRQGGDKPQIHTCVDEAAQCDAICERILACREEGVALMEQAVLFRAGHHSDQLEIELNRRNIPFVKYGGLRFLEAAHVKDLVAILRLLENPTDELSWYRVLQLLEGIGPAQARKTIDVLMGRAAGAESAQTVPAPLSRLLCEPPAVPPSARDEFRALRRMVAHCTGSPLPADLLEDGEAAPSAGDLTPAAQLERIRKFYEPIFNRTYDNPTVRLRDLEQLEQIARAYPTRSQFLADLTLDPPQSTSDLAGPPLLDEDFLILSTIHSAKGCEWEVVHVIHASDGNIPSDMATGNDEEIEEERRLLYVAMTRAKNALHLYFPLRYYVKGRGLTDRHMYAQLTRFITEKAKPFFTQPERGRRTAGASEETEAVSGTAKRIDQMLGELWE